MSITTRNGFRFFVIFSTIIGFGSLVDVVFPSLLSKELQDYFEGAEVTSYGIFLAIYSLIMSVLDVVSLIAILLFRKWGRTMTVVLTVIGVLVTPIYFEQISSGLSTAFASYDCIASGIILTLMYMSPVSEYFEKQT